VDQLDLRSCHHCNLHDPEQQNQYKGELDHCRAALCAHALFATEMTFCITVLKNDGSMSVLEAHPIRARATTAAATITRAYSAVAWPDCDRDTKRLTVLNIGYSLLDDTRSPRWEAKNSISQAKLRKA
jgi:hypothetical protein